jgi:hypothetical protein
MRNAWSLRRSGPLAAAAFVTGIGLIALASSPASAQQGSAEQQQACTPDVFRLCNAHIPDRGRIVACLRANHRALSPACRMVFGAPAKATTPRGKKRKVRRRV